MSKLNQLSLYEAKEGMIKKKFSSREITQDHIKAIKNCKNLNAFITEIPDLALQAADESDKRRTVNSSCSDTGRSAVVIPASNFHNLIYFR